jgi:V/A-type H+-transporting ATPase subunit F
MKMMVIGNPEAIRGFSLVGVNGRPVEDAEAMNQALDESLAAKDVGIILVTEDAAELVRTRMDHLMLHSTVPLVVEIPAPEGSRPDRPSLSEVVFKAIGVKL